MKPSNEERRKALAGVRRVLAKLYPRAEDARRVATEAGLSEATIDFSGSADSFWFNVINEAELQGSVEAILGIAKRENPDSGELKRVSATYSTTTHINVALLVLAFAVGFAIVVSVIACIARRNEICNTSENERGNRSCNLFGVSCSQCINDSPTPRRPIDSTVPPRPISPTSPTEPIGSTGPAGPSWTVLYAEQTGPQNTIGTGVWFDVPGVRITHRTSGPATVDLFVNGVMAAEEEMATGVATCSLRIVINNSPTGHPVDGIFVAEPRSRRAGDRSRRTAPFAFSQRVYRPPGPHTFQLQISKTQGDTNCSLADSAHVRVRFYATFH